MVLQALSQAAKAVVNKCGELGLGTRASATVEPLGEAIFIVVVVCETVVAAGD